MGSRLITIPRLKAHYHRTIENKGAHGGKVAMWVLHSDDPDIELSLAVVPDKNDFPPMVVRAINAHNQLVQALQSADTNLQNMLKLYPQLAGHECWPHYNKAVADAFAAAEGL